MSQEYWLIIEKPLWDMFPFIFRKKEYYGQTCEYYFVCEKYTTIKENLPKRWFVSLGVTTENGIRLLST